MKDLCMGCMLEKAGQPVCPHCGYDQDTPHFVSYLAPGSTLAGRYLVGRVLKYNGESVVYIGYDTLSNQRVCLREYFPDTLAKRAPDGKTVFPYENRCIQYKTYMEDYTELLRKLSKMRTLTCLVQVLEVFEENRTVYGVLEYAEGQTLSQYLTDKGIMMSWQEALDLLMPVFKTLSLVHQEGIIHRGISPDTILVTLDRTVKLDGFAISAVRAAHTELAAELFPGFSAPEQYSAVSPHGTWTDVYAVCAVLYAALTGQRPPEALLRSQDQPLMSPRERNQTISLICSTVLLQGLSIDTSKRIRTIDELLSRLTGAPAVGGESPTVVIPTVPKKPSVPSAPLHAQAPQPLNEEDPDLEEAPEDEADMKAKNRRLVLTSLLITLPILLIILILTFWFLFGGRRTKPEESSDSSYSESSEESEVSEEESSEESSEESGEESSDTASSAETYSMDNLVGKRYDDVIANAAYKKLYTFSEVTREYSENYEEGVIIWQSVTPGIEIEAGTSVRLRVSQGSRYITLPSWQGQDAQSYLAKLDSLNVQYIKVFKETSAQAAGTVIGTSMGTQTQYDISALPIIEIYIAEAPASSAEPSVPSEPESSTPESETPSDPDAGSE